MNRKWRLLCQISSILAVVLFCVSAAASIGDIQSMDTKTFSEPINLLLIGVGLIGFGSVVKRISLR
jgi:hypothetical protein